MHVLAHLLLVARERLHAVVQVARHQILEVVAIPTDELAQEVDGQEVLALALLSDNDLRQHRAGEVFAGLGVIDHEVGAILYHLAQVVERDIAARRGVVEPPVGVFLDDDGVVARRAFLCHGAFASAPHPGTWGQSAHFNQKCCVAQVFIAPHLARHCGGRRPAGRRPPAGAGHGKVP